MTDLEAITVLEDILHYVEPADPPQEHDAVKRAIVALKQKVEREKGEE